MSFLIFSIYRRTFYRGEIVKFFDKYWLHIVMVCLVLGACIRVARLTSGVEMFPRADTSEFIAVESLNPTLIPEVFELIVKDYPNETPLCFFGFVKDSTMSIVREESDTIKNREWKIAVIDSVGRSQADSLEVTPTSISYYGRMCEKNDRLIGIGHTHPITFPFFMCEHSSEDALALHNHNEVLFSLLFCPDGNELLWQDGRRIKFYLGN
jgi:hypothetical protein